MGVGLEGLDDEGGIGGKDELVRRWWFFSRNWDEGRLMWGSVMKRALGFRGED